MRRAGYIIGIVLLVVGAAIGMAELLTYVQGEPSRLSLGAIWFRVHANSLVGFQSLIENGLSPAVWPPVQWLLEIAAWLLLIPVGLVLTILCWPRSRA
ncbi:MAG: hypothetical protein R3349_09125 [Geminicoccaceae bacterium]|nr:hypothetical protein [Geminicoccaceae bacterium]